MAINMKNLIPLANYNDVYSHPTVGALRQLRFRNRDNKEFLSKVFKNINKRVYVDIAGLEAWIAEMNGCDVA